MSGKKRVSNGAGRLFKFRLIILGTLFLMAVLIWGYNLLRLKTIEYEGLTTYTEQEFTKLLADSPAMKNTYLFYIRHALFPKEEIPFVEDYDVRLVNGTMVHVQVYEKLVIGCVEIMGKYMYFDKDGIVVESSSERIKGVPLITGLKFNEIVLYKKLQVQKQSLFTKILNLTKLLLQYEIEAERVQFDSDYEVTLSCGDIKVLLGRRDTYDIQLAALRGILDAAAGQAGTLDMRSYSRENPDVILK